VKNIFYNNTTDIYNITTEILRQYYGYTTGLQTYRSLQVTTVTSVTTGFVGKLHCLLMYRERRQPGQLAAFLLGMGPMPPPTQQELAIAAANHMLDNAAPGPANDTSGEENIDPQLRTQQVALANHPLSKSYNVFPS
jgi:hypothetical protein